MRLKIVDCAKVLAGGRSQRKPKLGRHGATSERRLGRVESQRDGLRHAKSRRAGNGRFARARHAEGGRGVPVDAQLSCVHFDTYIGSLRRQINVQAGAPAAVVVRKRRRKTGHAGQSAVRVLELKKPSNY
jgi:hypothetical protein